MAETSSSPASTPSSRPTKPDEEFYKAELAKAEAELAKAKTRLDNAKSKLELVQTKNQDTPQNQKITALRKELGEIRQKHQANKDARQKTQDVIKRHDEKLKSLINEQKNARAKVPYKSVEDIDREVARLQKQVDSGTMKIVDEKKALNDISALNRHKKGFAGFAAQQKAIDDVKAQIADLKKGNDNPEMKALNDRYDTIQAELNDMNKDRDAAFKNINALRDERSSAQAEQQEKWRKVKEIQDTYHQSRRAWRDFENQQRQARREKYAAEKAAFEAGKRRQVAQEKLEAASAPAYGEEILTAENLIRHFDPSAIGAKQETAASKFAATASRTVASDGFKGTRVMKKKDDEEDYFVGGGKKKKGKVGGATPASSKFSLSVDIIESLARIGIDPPVKQDEVPIVVTKLQDKIKHWKSDQERKTAENIAKAKKEIEKLEAETSPSAPANMNTGAKDTHSKPADANLGANGKVSAEAVLKQEQDAVADAAAEMEKAKIEDAAAGADA